MKSDKRIKHGKRYTRLYKIYYGMKGRCYYPSSINYKYYGGKGIKMCSEWENDFMSFYNWSMENGYSNELTIDRKDSDKNYSPENCKWDTMFVQNSSKKDLLKNNTLGFKGIAKITNSNKFLAQIGVNKKHIYIGSFETREEAAKGYDDYVIRNNLKRHLNYPTEEIK